MRFVVRIVRRLLGSVVVGVVLLSAVGYVVYAANGILDERQARDTRKQYDGYIVHTATALAERLSVVVMTTATATTAPTMPTTETSPPTIMPTETPVLTSIPTATLTQTAKPEPPPTSTPIPTNTLRARPTLIPTNTLRPTLILTNTLRPTIVVLPTSTSTPTPTHFPTMTSTPTATYTPSVLPTPTYVIEGTYAAPYEPPVVDIPLRMPLIDIDPDVVNFLLLGSDTSGGGVGHTDVIIVLSINKRVGSVAMWHLPRDLLVYIPNHTMERINLVYALGVSNNYPGVGFGLMKEMFLYNFGIEIDHYARVDFDDFMRIIEKLGGLDVSVDCAIVDWRLKAPELDPQDEDNWEYYTLQIGRQRLSPYMGLWYVRSRKTTSDLDRGRRQMDALRAMWHQAREQGLFSQVAQLWPEATQMIETDMTLTDVLSLAPIAANLDMSNIARYSGARGEHYVSFLTPDDGRDVLLPDRARLALLIQDFLTPPTENRLGRGAVTVGVLDMSGYGLGFELVAVDRLAWEGFAALPVPIANYRPQEVTLIYDYTGQMKGNALDDLMRVLRVSEGQVIAQPDPNRTVDFRVEIGQSYSSCVYGNAEDEIEAGPPVSGSSGE